MSEFHKAFYIICREHNIEHPRWRKCPKCIEVITYSEEEVKELIQDYLEDLGSTYKEIPFNKWFEQNKKK